VNTQLRGEFAARRDAVARAKLAGMDQGAELIAQLDVKGYVAFGL
jgi:predicted deacetylase